MNTTNPNYRWFSRKPRSHTLSRGRVGGINPVPEVLGIHNSREPRSQQNSSKSRVTRKNSPAPSLNCILKLSRGRATRGARGAVGSDFGTKHTLARRRLLDRVAARSLLTFSSSSLKGTAAAAVRRGRATYATSPCLPSSEVEIINLPTSACTRQPDNESIRSSEEETDDEDQDKLDSGSMAKDGGRGRGPTGRGRGKPKKNTGVRFNFDFGSRPSTSTPTTTTTTTVTTTPPFVATSGLSAGLPQMVMIPTPDSRVQSSDTAGAPQA
ncbi:hypothetical protein PIB30_048716 [Stylosanthes scabra]|uniref:Uncharacterized protein n=1 Tax=Stylosanthes scabra TaxID=79078 RepID=A0ABU6VJ42_9FABA|nr:hypothetical protein [Stylosanthes scabra]